jgi:hypothetical protein
LFLVRGNEGDRKWHLKISGLIRKDAAIAHTANGFHRTKLRVGGLPKAALVSPITILMLTQHVGDLPLPGHYCRAGVIIRIECLM